MASFSAHSWLLSLKAVLFSTGVISMAIALKLSIPVVLDFIVSEAPSIWSFFHAWLKPPYLYILVNSIIITIVASSKLQKHRSEYANSPDTVLPVPAVTSLPTKPVNISSDILTEYAVYDLTNTVVLPPVPSLELELVDVRREYDVHDGVNSNGYVDDAGVSANVLEPSISESERMLSKNKIINSIEAIITPSSVETSLQRKDSLDLSFSNEKEKPPLSARFGHRKAVKASPEGGKAALGVSKPKRHDTLESTWKTITDGRPMPLTRHVKTADTWDSQLRRNNSPLTDQNTPPNQKLTKKSETFNERSKKGRENCSPSPSPGSGKLRKEPSLSHDELNRRVEAFIKKFNDEMRLQRQESLRQYQEMINRGPH